MFSPPPGPRTGSELTDGQYTVILPADYTATDRVTIKGRKGHEHRGRCAGRLRRSALGPSATDQCALDAHCTDTSCRLDRFHVRQEQHADRAERSSVPQRARTYRSAGEARTPRHRPVRRLCGVCPALGLPRRRDRRAQDRRAEPGRLGTHLFLVRHRYKLRRDALVARHSRRRRGGALSLHRRPGGEMVSAQGARPRHVVLVDRNDDRPDAGRACRHRV